MIFWFMIRLKRGIRKCFGLERYHPGFRLIKPKCIPISSTDVQPMYGPIGQIYVGPPILVKKR